eukprot:gene4638-9206_t
MSYLSSRIIVLSLGFIYFSFSFKLFLDPTSKSFKLIQSHKLNALFAKDKFKHIRDDIIANESKDVDKSTVSITSIIDSINSYKLRNTESLGFFMPAEYEQVLLAFNERVDFIVQAFGGYPQAIKKRIIFRRLDDDKDIAIETMDRDQLKTFVAAVQISGSFIFDKATPSDFFDAITALGIDANQRGAQVLLTPEVVATAIDKLKMVRSVAVTSSSHIDLAELQVKPPTVKQCTSIEASTRIDAIGSAGFGISRSRMSASIDSGVVLMDWKAVRDSSTPVKVGSTLFVPGSGRLVVTDMSLTAKGRYRVTSTRYS